MHFNHLLKAQPHGFIEKAMMRSVVRIAYFIVIILGIGFVFAQEDGSYRSSGDDGRYRPGNEGRYKGNDGKYVEPKNKLPIIPKINSNFGFNLPVTPFVAAKPTTTTTTTKLPKVFAINVGESGILSNRFDEDTANVKILRQEQEVDTNGYRYVYETENGISAGENGSIEKSASGDEVLRSNGFYEFTGDDNIRYRVDYVADENGFVAKGEHLPTPPPIPIEIQKLLEDLATKQPET